MKHVLVPVAFAATLCAPSLSEARQVFHNPCERGPWPRVAIINETQAGFIRFLQDVRPGMPYSTAEQIGRALCDDLSLVGNPDGLSHRLNSLLRQYGY